MNSPLVRPSALGNISTMTVRFGNLFLLAAAALLLGAFSPAARAADADADRIRLAVDALTRLEGINLDANPSMKERVLKVLDKTRGTPEFVRLVQHFQFKDQNAGLLEVALSQPSGESGVEAMRMILSSGETTVLKSTLEGANTTNALKAVEAIGNTSSKDAMKLLLPLVSEPRQDAALRKQAVRSLARTSDGAKALLMLAKENKLADDLKLTASSELNAARWPDVQAEAAKVLPPLQGQNAQPLPPISELVKMKGDSANGAKVFSRAAPGCANCHIVRGQGMELGPNLSEIGTKLGKDALFESILDPSAGISFGFEAWTFTMKNDDEAYGLLASETGDEVTLKNTGGIVTKIKKSDVATRQQSKLSIMPAGLQAGMTTQEFVDLVEFLSSLKKQ